MANQAKGTKEMQNQIRHKKSKAFLLLAAGALLLAWGYSTFEEGQKMLGDMCGGSAVEKTEEKTIYLKFPDGAEATATIIPPKAKADKAISAGKAEASKVNPAAPPCVEGGTPGVCSPSCLFLGNDTQAESKKQTGMIMMAAGAGLIIWGMYTLGEVAELEDEQLEQRSKNKAIDKARQDMLDREEQKKMNKEKLIKYRMRTKQIEEREEEERRRRLQDAAESAR